MPSISGASAAANLPTTAQLPAQAQAGSTQATPSASPGPLAQSSSTNPFANLSPSEQAGRMQMLKASLAVVSSLANLMSAFAGSGGTAAAPSTSSAGAPVPATNGGAQTAAGDPVDVYVLDDFRPNGAETADPGFNHGETVAGVISANTQGDNVVTHKIGLYDGVSDKDKAISDNLDALIAKSQANPGSVDVVNLSQAALTNTATTAGVQEKIKQLEASGATVVVAAGNAGAGTTNALAPQGGSVTDPNAPLVVAATEGSSGIGNITANVTDADQAGRLRKTSFAAPQITALVAKFKAQGLNEAQIREALAAKQAEGNGVINGTVKNVFTQNTTVAPGQEIVVPPAGAAAASAGTAGATGAAKPAQASAASPGAAAADIGGPAGMIQLLQMVQSLLQLMMR